MGWGIYKKFGDLLKRTWLPLYTRHSRTLIYFLFFSPPLVLPLYSIDAVTSARVSLPKYEYVISTIRKPE